MTSSLKQSSFRMTPELEHLLEGLEAKLGVGRGDVIRIAIRKLAEREGVRIEPPKKPKKK